MSAIPVLTGADYGVIAIIAVSTLISLLRGFVKEAISLMTWVIAFLVAFKFSSVLADLFTNHIKSSSLRTVLAFAIIFVVILICGALINYLISTLIRSTGLSGTDRLLGMLFGFARGILLVGVVVLLADLSTFINQDWWQKSLLIPHFQSLATWLHSFLPEKLGSTFHNL